MTVKFLSSTLSCKLVTFGACLGLLMAYQRYPVHGLGSDSIQKLTYSVDK